MTAPAAAKTHLARQLKRARRALALERAAPLAAPVAIVAALWAAIALTGALDWIPPLAASLAVMAALFALAALTFRALRAWRKPTPQEARARLEQDATLDPGALAAFDDRPARVDPLALALWRRERDRANARVLAARARPPRPDLTRADPWRLRYAAAGLFALGVLIAGMNAPERFVRAFVPDPGPLLGDEPLLIEAWATPAAYTGAGPIALSDRVGTRVETPPKLEATVRVVGAVGAPVLRFTGAEGRFERRFEPTADGAWEATLPVDSVGRLEVVRFFTKARWRLAPQVDRLPDVAIMTPPAFAGTQLKLGWEVKDDYGVRGLALEIAPVDPPPGLQDTPPLRVALEAPPGAPKSAVGDSEIDLAAFDYAGLPVEVRLVALDGADQAGRSAPMELLLPEPTFLQPVAKAAIEIRRDILWDRRPYAPPPDPRGIGGFVRYVVLDHDFRPLSRAPEGLRTAARLLDSLMMIPQDGFFPDLAVYAGLAAARAALEIGRDQTEARAAADLLWHVAMRAEFGSSADARAALEQARRALADGLARRAPPDEIARLSDNVRRAMDRYLDALVAEALRNMQVEGPQDTPERAADFGRQDLEALMDEVDRLANSGQVNEAMALLSQIAGLLDNLEVRVQMADGDGQGGQSGSPELNELLQGLSGAMGAQRTLRDETDRAARGDGAPGDGQGEGAGDGGGPGGLANRQERLAEGLDAARDQLRALPDDGEEGAAAADRARDALDDAEAAMRGAADALRRGDLEGARARQDEALSALRSGADTLADDQLRQDRARRGEAGAAESAGGARDPLGRPTGGQVGDGEGSAVPDQVDAERAREIRDELRRRIEDPRRPAAERDYLRRLLERFEGA